SPAKEIGRSGVDPPSILPPRSSTTRTRGSQGTSVRCFPEESMCPAPLGRTTTLLRSGGSAKRRFTTPIGRWRPKTLSRSSVTWRRRRGTRRTGPERSGRSPLACGKKERDEDERVPSGTLLADREEVFHDEPPPPVVGLPREG